MAKQTINLGTMADNKSGDPLRTAFTKVNENFTELYAGLGSGTSWALVKDGATVAAIEEAINEYGATLDLLQQAFAVGVDDPNYPWGANPEQLNYLTYEQLMNFNGDGGASSAMMNAVDKAHNADIAYRAYRDLIVSATVSSGEKEWSFDNEGVLTLPANGTIKDSDGNVVIANLDKLIISGGTIGTTNDNGGWGGYDIYLAPNGEGYAWIGVPRDISAANGASLVLGNTHPNGSGVQIVTNGSTWEFENGGVLHLPTNGDIVDSNGVSVITGTPPVTELPEWLTTVATEHLPTRNVDYGWDSNGVWTTNATVFDNQEGISYPIRYNGTVPATYGTVIEVDFVVNDLGADFGIGVWETGTDPIWQWFSFTGGNRIGAQYNGTWPQLYGITGEGLESRFALAQGQTYTARLTLTPPTDGFIMVTLETLQNDTVLDTISYQEQAFTTSYSIGFASDQDDGTNKTYMKNLTININNAVSPLTDTLISYNSGAPTAPITGAFTFAGGNATVHNRDMDIRTTRDEWGTDADIGIYAADDLWLTAEGDMIRLEAASTIELTTNTSEMSRDTWNGTGEMFDFTGVWDGTTLTITTDSNNSQVTTQLDVYLQGTFAIWFKIVGGGTYEISTSGNATMEVVDTNNVYTLPVNTTSPAADLSITSLKLIAGPTYAGVKTWILGDDGSTEFPSGITLQYNPEQTITNNSGFVIEIADLASATASWGAPVINSDNIQTTGWDYISFSNSIWYDYLYNATNGQGGVVSVTWAAGSEQVQGSIYVQFTDPPNATFQFTPSPDGGSPWPGTWYFPLSIGTSTTTIIPAAHSQMFNNKEWKYDVNGNTEFPGSITVASIAKTGGTTEERIALDLSKSIQKLSDGYYSLADGQEGQIMHLVSSGEINYGMLSVEMAHGRNPLWTGAGWWLFPFIKWDPVASQNVAGDGVCTLIFTDGAWQSSTGIWAD